MDWIRSLVGVAQPVHRFRDLCSLLAASSDSAPASALLETSRSISVDDARYPEIVRSLGASSNSECHARVLDIIGGSATHGDEMRKELKRVAVELAATSTSFLSEAISRLAEASGQVAQLIADVLAELRDQDAALALLRYGQVGLIERSLHRLIQVMTDTATPIPNQRGAYWLRPREASWLRRQLAALLLSPDPERCALASRLLVGIRVKRIERGEPSDEPLHPDISLLDRLRGIWELRCAVPSGEQSDRRGSSVIRA